MIAKADTLTPEECARFKKTVSGEGGRRSVGEVEGEGGRGREREREGVGEVSYSEVKWGEKKP